MKHILLASLVLLLIQPGCSAPSQQRVPFPSQDVTVTRDDLARIYFVRTGWVGIVSDDIRVYDADTEIGGLTYGTYLCWERAGGRSVGRVVYDPPGPGVEALEGYTDLDCPAGHAYYFGVTIDRQRGDPSIQLLDPEEGRRLVSERDPAGSG